jgi:hypothetical protein
VIYQQHSSSVFCEQDKVCSNNHHTLNEPKQNIHPKSTYKAKAKAVPLHAMKVLGGEEV